MMTIITAVMTTMMMMRMMKMMTTVMNTMMTIVGSIHVVVQDQVQDQSLGEVDKGRPASFPSPLNHLDGVRIRKRSGVGARALELRVPSASETNQEGPASKISGGQGPLMESKL